MQIITFCNILKSQRNDRHFYKIEGLSLSLPYKEQNNTFIFTLS